LYTALTLVCETLLHKLKEEKWSSIIGFDGEYRSEYDSKEKKKRIHTNTRTQQNAHSNVPPGAQSNKSNAPPNASAARPLGNAPQAQHNVTPRVPPNMPQYMAYCKAVLTEGRMMDKMLSLHKHTLAKHCLDQKITIQWADATRLEDNTSMRLLYIYGYSAQSVELLQHILIELLTQILSTTHSLP
jgi:hypothetical protein